MKRIVCLLAAATAAAASASPAAAWTRPGHMVTAAIAYDEIVRRRPDLVDAIGKILDAHPDRAPFEVAVDRSLGRERQRRMFLECARWPDDMRLTAYDHPGWHAVLWPVLARDAPAAARGKVEARGGRPAGQALEGLALNASVLSDRTSSAAEKAVSLCWLLHVVGDIHQPLHTAELFSATYPDGDHGAGAQFIQDPITHEPISLHWLWDDSVNRSGIASDVDARAGAIEAAHPRAGQAELKAPTDIAEAPNWARDSHALAESFAYPSATSLTSPTPAAAMPTPAALWTEVRARAERRVALAGYRIADVVIAAMDEAD